MKYQLGRFLGFTMPKKYNIISYHSKPWHLSTLEMTASFCKPLSALSFLNFQIILRLILLQRHLLFAEDFPGLAEEIIRRLNDELSGIHS